jgi:hypothetical protein
MLSVMPPLAPAADAPAEIELTLQSRDAKSGDPAQRTVKLNPKNVAIIMVDTWNFHWCTTATGRCGSFAGRFNKALPVLEGRRYLSEQDMPAARSVLKAAAYTYVAAALATLLNIARWARFFRF